MKKYLSLVFKDMILIKKYLLVTLLIDIAIPLLFYWKLPSIGTGFAAFLTTYIFSVYMSLQSLAVIESKYPKAETIMCATPYMRRPIVIARYGFAFFLYIGSLIVYALLSLFVKGIVMISVSEALYALLIGSVLLGISLPLTYKLGFEKMKYVSMIVIMATPFAIPYLAKLITESSIDFGFLLSVSVYAKCFAAIALTAGVLLLSAMISVKIYNSKEM